MANIVVCSNRYEDDWHFAEQEDYIGKLMESVVLVPSPEVDAVIAECWCPIQATDMWYYEHADELFDEDSRLESWDDDFYEYYYECGYDNSPTPVRVIGGVIAYLVKTNDVEGMMSYLRDSGIRIL